MHTKKSTSVQKVGNHLYLVPLPTPMKGFEGFVTSWVYTAGPVVLVDAGPSSSAFFLLEALSEIGVKHLDGILLTHIHIDHAGGAGIVAEAFRNTPVVCHPKGMSHLADPTRLWEGSLKTLGDVARAYGPIAAVKQEQLMPADQVGIRGITAIETLGHAPHHVSYLVDEILFAGEAGGVCLSFSDGSFYLRPATPPRFFLDTCLDSIDKLLGVEARGMCYGHVGMRNHPGAMLKQHRDQLLRWADMVRPFYEQSDGNDDRESMIACREHLLAHDPLLTAFSSLEKPQQERERGFLFNSIKGYWGYLGSR